MNKRVRLLSAGVIAPLGLVSLMVSAQPASEPAAVPATVPAAVAAAVAALSEPQLDQLLAPIALYPDALIGPILVAATYPLEAVEAHRWLQVPANAALRGAALEAALQQQPWDVSVKSLVPFAPILQMMDHNLDWTERMGDAFLAQQSAVMDSIQRFRQRAASSGSLTSTRQQNLSTLDQQIEIESASADAVYVPYYDPNMVYGTWPWPADPPYELPLPPGTDISAGATVSFGPAVPILLPLWGWEHWNWRRHMLLVNSSNAPGTGRPWQHDPSHRRGVPYHNPTVASHYAAPAQGARRAPPSFVLSTVVRAANQPRAAAVNSARPVEHPRSDAAHTSAGHAAGVERSAARPSGGNLP